MWAASRQSGVERLGRPPRAPCIRHTVQPSTAGFLHGSPERLERAVQRLPGQSGPRLAPATLSLLIKQTVTFRFWPGTR